MRKILALLLILFAGDAAAYASTQVWKLTPIAGTAAAAGSASTPQGTIALATAVYPQYTWLLCDTTNPMTLHVSSQACNNSSYTVFLFSSSCNAGDTIDAAGLVCTAAVVVGAPGPAGPAGAAGEAGASTATGDNGTGLASWLNSKINAVLAWFLSLITGLFASLWTVLSDFFIFAVDKIFDLVVYVVSGIVCACDLNTFSPTTYWAMLPPNLISVLNLIGVPSALGLIVCALGLRFLLQLIPFVRWGS